MSNNTYEYAGFQYRVNPDGSMTPLPGQHPAAGKPKHLQAARDCYLQDLAHEARQEKARG